MQIQYRNIVMVYILGFITLGIYFIYWLVQTKEEMNSLGANIPTAWLIIIPIANIYWAWKYFEAFSQYVKKDDNAILWFILYILIGIIMPAIVQAEMNKLANQSN
jgi:hypothetical protein